MKYIKKNLNNGLTIIYVPMTKTNVISMGFFVRVGSRYETDANAGIAHFLEHMMFKGTKNRTSKELLNEMDLHGLVYNAATTTQSTYYYAYGNFNDTKKILDIMLDIFINPEFNHREIEKEKKIVIDEMNSRFDSPFIKLFFIMHQKIFKNTSLERDIIGTKDSILSLKKSDLVNFRNSFYVPKNTVFVMVGNFNPVIIDKIVSRNLSQLVNDKTEDVDVSHEKEIVIKNMNQQSEPFIFLKKNYKVRQTYVLLVFPLYDLYTKHPIEIDLISKLLSGGLSSKLITALREENGITYHLDTYPLTYNDVGVFVIQLTLSPVELITSLKIIFAELRKLKNQEITNDDLTKIKNISKNEELFDIINPKDIMTHIGLNFLSNPNFNPSLKNDFKDLDTITKKHILQTAKKIFVKDKINIFIYGNIEDNDDDYSFIDL